MLGPSRFCFLNQTTHLVEAKGWNEPSLERLYVYNLHYFDDLNAAQASERVDWHNALVERWITENPPGQGTGWEPYPLSLRIVNWVKWSLAGHNLTSAAVHSLAVQARFLARRLEHHLLGNHLFANAKALVFAGSFFDGDEAEEWRLLGMHILIREIAEQILADGGHFERSTMYHALALEDMLDLINLAGTYPAAFEKWHGVVCRWPSLAANMTRWLAAMCHPDGEISFFNDAAIGIARPPCELFRYSERLGIHPNIQMRDGVVWLKESGYIRAQRADAVLIADVAPVGPDYLPGHAHADTLSFELSVYGKRVIVNSGTSRYGLGPQREYERSTAAHSTLEIDGENSSEVWAGFRVARRAYPFDVDVTESDAVVTISAAHTGYRRLSGHSVHRRQWLLKSNSLVVSDQIEGRYSQAVVRYFLHPKVLINRTSGGATAMLDGISYCWTITGADVDIVTSKYSPQFGMEIPGTCIELSATNRDIDFCLTWSDASSAKLRH